MTRWTSFTQPDWPTHAQYGERANDGVRRAYGEGKLGRPYWEIEFGAPLFTRRPAVTFGNPFTGKGFFVNANRTKTQLCRVRMLPAYQTSHFIAFYAQCRKSHTTPQWEDFSRHWVPPTTRPEAGVWMPPNTAPWVWQDNIGSNFVDIRFGDVHRWEWRQLPDGRRYLTDAERPGLPLPITRPAAALIGGRQEPFQWDTAPSIEGPTVIVTAPGPVWLDSWENRADMDHVILGHVMAEG